MKLEVNTCFKVCKFNTGLSVECKQRISIIKRKPSSNSPLCKVRNLVIKVHFLDFVVMIVLLEPRLFIMLAGAFLYDCIKL